MKLYEIRMCVIYLILIRGIYGFPSPIGPSVFLKFGLVYEVQKYVTEVHFIEAGNLFQYGQIQRLQYVSPPVFRTLHWRHKDKKETKSNKYC